MADRLNIKSKRKSEFLEDIVKDEAAPFPGVGMRQLQEAKETDAPREAGTRSFGLDPPLLQTA